MLVSIISGWILSAALGAVVAPGAPPPRPSAPLDAELKLGEALEAASRSDAATAIALLDTLLAATDFARQPSAHRYQVTALSGLLAQATERNDDARRLLSAATAFDEASADIWRACADVSVTVSDHAEAARCVTQLLRRWPENATNLDEYFVFGIAEGLGESGNVAAHLAMLEALFDTGWSSDRFIIDNHWMRLVELLLGDGRVAKAGDVAARIDYARTIVSMRIDRRFDAIAALRPGVFDVDAALARTDRKDSERMARLPGKLAPVMLRHGNLMHAGRYREVLEGADRVIASVRDGSATFEDLDAMYPWILNQRSDALAALGEWDDAVHAMEQGARRPTEEGGLNVSQIINLAQLYIRVGRPDDALATVAEIGAMSAYGRMLHERVRLQAAVALRDRTMTTASLEALRAQRDEDADAWQTALIAAGDLDAAADLLVQRLRDAPSRSDALLDVQDWKPKARTRWDRTQARRWRQVLARPAVRAAVREVGRSETFPTLTGF